MIDAVPFQRFHSWLLVDVSCLLLMFFSGCGKKDESLAEVTGVVMFCGQPAIAEVLFEPVDMAGKSIGRASAGTSDESGRFRLMLDESQAGAKIGRNRVSIRVQRVASSGESLGDSPDGVIGALKSTQFLRQVQSNSNHFHFWLTY